MHYSLRAMEGKLLKTVAITTSEKDGDDKYVFRGEDGEIFMWSPRPVRYEYHCVVTVAEADSVSFLCPTCFAKNGGPVGTHGVHVTFAGRGVPDEAGSRGTSGPTRWEASGATIDDLVLTPSIQLNPTARPEEGHCQWHGFVGSNGVPPGHAG